MAEKIKTQISPKGIAKFAYLTKPDTAFNKSVYRTQLLLDPKDPLAIAFTNQLQEQHDAAFEQMKKENPKFARVMKEAALPFNEELDKDGNLTGLIEVKFKANSQFTDKKAGEVQYVTIAKVNKQGKPLADELAAKIGSGSTLKVAFKAIPFFMATEKQAGITLRMLAVQVIDLVEFGSSNFGFVPEGDQDEDEDTDAPAFSPAEGAATAADKQPATGGDF